jgi:type IV pilus modification protein PilV
MNKIRQRGFNLIEILVALVVLSMGLLGIVGLQLSSIRNTQSSYSRSLAVAAMNDLAERIYANNPGALAGNYSGLDSATINCAVAPAPICALEASGAAAPAACTPAQMATYDFFVAACGLPSGASRVGGVTDLLTLGRIRTICAAVCPPSSLNIIVNWNDRGSSGDANVNGQAASLQQTTSMWVQP